MKLPGAGLFKRKPQQPEQQESGRWSGDSNAGDEAVPASGSSFSVKAWTKDTLENVGYLFEKTTDRLNDWAAGNMVGHWFRFKDRGTNFTTECRAGFMTFLMVSYVLAVTPAILTTTGGTCSQQVCHDQTWGKACLANPNDSGAVDCMELLKKNLITATAASSLISTFLIGFLANLPLALCPGVGITAYVAYDVVGQFGQGQLTYSQAMTAIFVEGWIFILLSITGVRGGIVKYMPKNIAMATSVGIGLLLAFTGLAYLQVVVFDPSTLLGIGGCNPSDQTWIYSFRQPLNMSKVPTEVAAGDLTSGNISFFLEPNNFPLPATAHGCASGTMRSAAMWLGIAGGLLMALLLFAGVKGSLVIGILFVTIISWIPGHAASYLGADSPIAGGENRMEVFKQVVALPTLNMTGLAWDWSAFGNGHLWLALLTFLYIDLLDCTGTLLSMARLMEDMLPGFMSEHMEFPGQMWAFLSDGVGIITGSMMGVTPLTVYIESAAGIEDGGRTGMTALVVSFFFLVSLFFSPILASIPGYATGPALVLVGTLLLGHIAHIEWDDIGQAIPAFLTIIIMPFTYSVAYGVIAGLLAYVAIHTPFWLWDTAKQRWFPDPPGSADSNPRGTVFGHGRRKPPYPSPGSYAGSEGGMDGGTYHSAMTIPGRGAHPMAAAIARRSLPFSGSHTSLQAIERASDLDGSRHGLPLYQHHSQQGGIPIPGVAGARAAYASGYGGRALAGGLARVSGMSRAARHSAASEASDLPLPPPDVEYFRGYPGTSVLRSRSHGPPTGNSTPVLGSSPPYPGTLKPQWQPQQPLPPLPPVRRPSFHRSNTYSGPGGLSDLCTEDELEQHLSASYHEGDLYSAYMQQQQHQQQHSLSDQQEHSGRRRSGGPLAEWRRQLSDPSHELSAPLAFSGGAFKLQRPLSMPPQRAAPPSPFDSGFGQDPSFRLFGGQQLPGGGGGEVAPAGGRGAGGAGGSSFRLFGDVEMVEEEDLAGQGSAWQLEDRGQSFRLFGDVQLPNGQGEDGEEDGSAAGQPDDRRGSFRLFGDVQLPNEGEGEGGEEDGDAALQSDGRRHSFRLFGDVQLPNEQVEEGEGGGSSPMAGAPSFQLFGEAQPLPEEGSSEGGREAGEGEGPAGTPLERAEEGSTAAAAGDAEEADEEAALQATAARIAGAERLAAPAGAAIDQFGGAEVAGAEGSAHSGVDGCGPRGRGGSPRKGAVAEDDSLGCLASSQRTVHRRSKPHTSILALADIFSGVGSGGAGSNGQQQRQQQVGAEGGTSSPHSPPPAAGSGELQRIDQHHQQQQQQEEVEEGGASFSRSPPAAGRGGLERPPHQQQQQQQEEVEEGGPTSPRSPSPPAAGGGGLEGPPQQQQREQGALSSGRSLRQLQSIGSMGIAMSGWTDEEMLDG